MEKPGNVVLAVNLLWYSLAFGAVVLLVMRWMGWNADDFMAGMLFSAIFCVLPYKIGNGSNAARVVLAVFFVLMVAMDLGGIDDGMQKTKGAILIVETVGGIVTDVLVAVALVLLFRNESNEWFRAQRATR